jgi:hypothetical protein
MQYHTEYHMAFLMAVNDSRHGRFATTFAQDCAKASEQDRNRPGPQKML